MSEDALIRLENLGLHRTRKGWTFKQLAEAVGRSPAQISDMFNGRRGFGEDLARDFEERLGLPRYWLDVPHTDGDENSADRLLKSEAARLEREFAETDREAFSPMAMHLATCIDRIADPAEKAKAFAAAIIEIQKGIDADK